MRSGRDGEAVPVWLQVAGTLALIGGGIGGVVLLVHRVTAPSARRWQEAHKRAFYADMAARGRNIALPRTWESEGFDGHLQRTREMLSLPFRMAFAMTAAVFVVAAVFREAVDWRILAAEAALGCAVFAALYFGLRFYESRRVRRILAQAGGSVPRTAFKVVANGHGLFVPIEGRALEGAWSEWIVTDADVISGKGNTACLGLSLACRAEPELKVPLVASMFRDGDRLLEVVAARAGNGLAAP